MAQYWEDWAGQTVGNEPTGWTKRWVTSGVTAQIVTDAAAPGGKSLRITKSANGRFAITMDAVDSDADRANINISALVRAPSNPGDSVAYTFFGPLGRGAGAAAAETAYYAFLREETTNARTIQINSYVGGTSTSATGIATPAWEFGATYWMHLSISGTTLRFRLAAQATPQTTIKDSGDITYNDISAAGWAGIFAFSLRQSDILAVGIGTGGDAAPTEAPVVDTTAPTLSSPTSSSTGAASGSGGVTTNEANGTLYAVATTSATAPTKAQVKAGQTHTGATAPWSGNQAVSSTGAKSATVTGLTASTTYYLHFMHEDASANQSEVATSASFTTDTPDTTAPTLTGATATATGSTAATGSVSTNEATGTLYFVTSANASESVTTVKAGSGQSVTTTGTQSVSVTGLTAETPYYLHFVHRDAAGNDSEVVSSAQFTTAAAPTALEYVFTGDSFNINPTGSTVTGGDTSTPTVVIVPRKQRIIDNEGDYTKWRTIYGKITGANGKRPLFKLLRADYSGTISSSWKPWYSYDNVNWQRFPTPTLNGLHYDFQLATGFTSDDVWIGFQPGYPMSRVTALRDELVSLHPDKIHQLPSASSSHIVNILASQTDELGNTVPSQPFYGYGIWNDGAFGGTGTKRAIVLTCGIHPGEHVGDYVFEGFVRFLVSDDADAVLLRNNYQFIVYPNTNPVGRYGGHIRGQWDPVAPYKNANRDFGTDGNAFQMENSSTLRDALIADLAGRELAGSLDFHGQHLDGAGKPPAFWFIPDTANATLTAAWLTRMRAYNSSYEGLGSSAGPSACTQFMQRVHGSRHAYTPEAYEQHPATSGVDEWRTVGEHFAKSFEDSLSEMSWDGLIPALPVSIPLAFANAAPAKLQYVLVTSDMGITAAEIESLWGIV